MSTTESSSQPSEGFFSNLLKPGSSLSPTFLLVLDGAFAILLTIFVILLFLLSGSMHIVVLIGVEVCLWASVKWFVFELRNAQAQQAESTTSTDESKKTQ